MRLEKLTYVGEGVSYAENFRFNSAQEFKIEDNYPFGVNGNLEYEKHLKRDGVLKKQPENSIFYFDESSTCVHSIPRTEVVGVSLARLLKVGSLCVAVMCLETLLFLGLGIPEFGILNPFAAILFLIASPFFFWMGKLARY